VRARLAEYSKGDQLLVPLLWQHPITRRNV
jgi:hypothetical protein